MEKQGENIESEKQSDTNQFNPQIRENDLGEITMEIQEHTLEGNGNSINQGGYQDGQGQTENNDNHNFEEKQAVEQEQGLHQFVQVQVQDLGAQEEIEGAQLLENVENVVDENNENYQNQIEQQNQPAENPPGEEANNDEQAQNVQQQQQPQQNQQGENRADLAEEPSIQQFSTLVSAMNNEPFLNEETLLGIYELLQLNSIDMFDDIDTRDPTWKEKVDHIMKLRVDLANKKAVALSQIYQKNIPSNEMHSVEKIMAIFKSKQKEIYISKIPQGPCTCSHGEAHDERKEQREEHSEEKNQYGESRQQERNERIQMDDIVFIRESVGLEDKEPHTNEETRMSDKKNINNVDETINAQDVDNSKQVQEKDNIHDNDGDNDNQKNDIPVISQPNNVVDQPDQPIDDIQQAELEIKRLKKELAQNEIIKKEQEIMKRNLEEKNRQLKEEYLDILEQKRQLREEYNHQLSLRKELMRQQANGEQANSDQQEQEQGQQNLNNENSDELEETEHNNNENQRYVYNQQVELDSEEDNSNNIHEEDRQIYQSEQEPTIITQPQSHEHCESDCCPSQTAAAAAPTPIEEPQPAPQEFVSSTSSQTTHNHTHTHGNPSQSNQNHTQDILNSNAQGLSMSDIQSIMEMQFVDLRKCKSLDTADNSITFDMNNNYSIRIRSCEKVRIDTTSICSQIPHFIFQDHLFPFLTSVELFRVRGVSPEWREMVREIWHKTFKRGMQEQLLATSLCKEIESQFKLLHLRNPFFQKLNVLLHAMVEVVNWDDFNRKCVSNTLTVSDQKVVIALLRVLGHNMFGYTSLNDYNPEHFQTAGSSIAVQLKSIVMDSIARGAASSQDLKYVNSHFLQSPDISIASLMSDTDKNSIIFALLAKQFFLYSLLKNFITCSSVYMAATKHKLDSISHNFLTANGFLEGAYRILLLRNVSIKNGQIVTDDSDDGDKNLLTTPLTRDKPKKSKKNKKRDAAVQVQQTRNEEGLHQENVINVDSQVKESVESENKELVQNTVETQEIEKIIGQEEKEDNIKQVDKECEQVQQQEQEAIQYDNQQVLEVKEVNNQDPNIEESHKADDKDNLDEIHDDEGEDEDEEEDEDADESSESEITQLMKSIFNLNKSNKDDPDIVIKRKTGTLKIFLDQGTKLDIILNTVINFGIQKIQRINQAKEEALQNVEDQKNTFNKLQEQYLRNKDQIEQLKEEGQQLRMEKMELLNEREQMQKNRQSSEEINNNEQHEQENYEQQEEIHGQDDQQQEQIEQNGQKEQQVEQSQQEQQNSQPQQQELEEDAMNEEQSNC